MSATTQRHGSNVRANTPKGKRNVYRIRSYGSDVDETLFGHPARYNAQKDTPRIYPEDVNWDPPWVTSPKKTGAPLLWSPFGPDDAKSVNSARKSLKAASPRSPSTPKNKYRPKNHVPSYVDETLFATPKKCHVVKTPWAIHDEESSPRLEQSSVPAVWSSPHLPHEGVVPEAFSSRPLEEQMSEAPDSMHYTPVIKPRPGSTILTPQSQKRSKPVRKENRPVVYGVQQKLDFCIENGANHASDEHDPDAIIERALKLAGISRNSNQYRPRSNSLDGLSSRSHTPGRYFWKRPGSPASSTGVPGTPQSSRFSPRSAVKKPELQVDDLFSATGTRIPLSARSASGRPDSARTANTEDSVPGLDLSRPSKLYGMRSPRSARSVRSAHSTIMNRPSWRP